MLSSRSNISADGMTVPRSTFSRLLTKLFESDYIDEWPSATWYQNPWHSSNLLTQTHHILGFNITMIGDGSST